MIFAFLNAFLIFCSAVLWVLFVFSLADTVVLIGEKSGYEKKCAKEAEKQMNNIALAGGFGQGFFDGILEGNVKKDNLETFINSARKSENFETENNVVLGEINDKIFSFAEREIGSFSLETRAILEETATLCMGEIERVFYPDLIRHFCTFLGRFNSSFLVGASVSAALFFCSSFLLFKRDKTRLKTSLFSAFLMCFSAPAFLIVFLSGKTFGISHLWLKDFFALYVDLLLFSLVFLSFIFLILALCIKKHPVST